MTGLPYILEIPLGLLGSFFFFLERHATRTLDLGYSISMQIMVVPNVGFDPKRSNTLIGWLYLVVCLQNLIVGLELHPK
jgi:hypothetical protein